MGVSELLAHIAQGWIFLIERGLPYAEGVVVFNPRNYFLQNTYHS